MIMVGWRAHAATSPVRCAGSQWWIRQRCACVGRADWVRLPFLVLVPVLIRVGRELGDPCVASRCTPSADTSTRYMQLHLTAKSLLPVVWTPLFACGAH